MVQRVQSQIDSKVRTVAVIPARGGSKGVPGKNLKRIGGRSLVERAVEACQQALNVDFVVVSTDDEDIAAHAGALGAHVVERPPELSDDNATSESALVHALDEIGAEGVDPTVVAFVQCTSPFIAPEGLDEACRRVLDGRADSVFAAVETYDFMWRMGESGGVVGLNHDQAERLRRQDRRPDWRETGAFYVMSVSGFRAANHRFFGRIAVQPVAAADAIEIDTPEELDLARAQARLRADFNVGLAGVDVLVTDFDGVHTNDRAIVSENGSESVIVNRRDGHGFKLLGQAGVKLLILSTERNPVVRRRAEKLGVECLHGIEDKGSTLAAWLVEHDLDPASVAYLGNDVNDLGCLEIVGFPMCVADAATEVQQVSGFVTKTNGGEGAIREVADAVLAARQ